MSEFGEYSRQDSMSDGEWMRTSLIPRSEVMTALRDADRDAGPRANSAAEPAADSTADDNVSAHDGPPEHHRQDEIATEPVPRPLPPSFFPSNTGRIRPAVVAAIRAEAAHQTTDGALPASVISSAQPAYPETITSSVIDNGSDTVLPNGVEGSVEIAATHPEAGIAGGISAPSSNGTASGGKVPSGTGNAPQRIPRIRYSSQYHTLH